jgi:hypothetical protein
MMEAIAKQLMEVKERVSQLRLQGTIHLLSQAQIEIFVSLL